MRCSEAREMLPAYLKDGETTLALRRHLSRCDACRTELTQYEKVMSSLAGLDRVTVTPPPDLVSALMAIPSEASRVTVVRTHLSRNRRAYLGGAVVALAGAAAGAFALRRRGRLATA